MTRKIDRIIELLENIESKLEAPSKSELDNLLSQIVARVWMHWKDQGTPMELSVLSRGFGRTAKRFGGLRFLIQELASEKRLDTLLRISNAILIFPPGKVAELTPAQLVFFREQGLKAETVTRLRREELKKIEHDLKGSKQPEFSQEDEAEIDRLCREAAEQARKTLGEENEEGEEEEASEGEEKRELETKARAESEDRGGSI